MNASVPNLSTTNPNSVTLSHLLTTAQSSPNLTIANPMNITDVILIDDESMPIDESRSLSEVPISEQQQKQNDETSEDEDIDDDEPCQLKRVKTNDEQIQSSVDRHGEQCQQSNRSIIDKFVFIQIKMMKKMRKMKKTNRMMMKVNMMK